LVDTAERGDIDGLTTDGTGGSDTGAVFARTTVDDGINGDLDWVLVGHDVDLKKGLVRAVNDGTIAFSTYDLEGVCDDADSHELLSVVTTVHHQRVGKTLDDWALCLSESLLGISAGGVRNVHWCSDLDVVAIEDFRVSPYVPSAEPMPLVAKSSYGKVLARIHCMNCIALGDLTSRRYHGSQHPRNSIC
jgi:hypothetical protein